jgi:hypothetical protein
LQIKIILIKYLICNYFIYLNIPIGGLVKMANNEASTNTRKTVYSTVGGAMFFGNGSNLSVKVSKSDDNRYHNLVLNIINTDENGKFLKINDVVDSGSVSFTASETYDLSLMLNMMLAGKTTEISISKVTDGKGVVFEIVKNGKAVCAAITYYDNNSVSKEYIFDFASQADKLFKLYPTSDPNDKGEEVTIENYGLGYFAKIIEVSIFYTSGVFAAANSIAATRSLSSSSSFNSTTSTMRSRRLLGRANNDSDNSSTTEKTEKIKSEDIASIDDMLQNLSED